ncbi:hypothetical protein WN51_03744 [Melipona quadrifasciata]|uniref:Uncharacterized protein n=1 Tax=Melipona quadrifasciata TaxID=166423 RepID=A0A0M8ZUW9_9HYME|nr:hypothetical protein WN51_03744 [Melipona quadrifasciata]
MPLAAEQHTAVVFLCALDGWQSERTGGERESNGESGSVVKFDGESHGRVFVVQIKDYLRMDTHRAPGILDNVILIIYLRNLVTDNSIQLIECTILQKSNLLQKSVDCTWCFAKTRPPEYLLYHCDST